MMNTQGQLRKGRKKMLTGVAAGVAEYAGLDPTLVRLAFVLLTLAGGPGLILYIILALVMPQPE